MHGWDIMEETASICFADPNSEFAAKYPNGLSLADLIPFYEEVAQNTPIQLEWKFPGRIKRPTAQEIEAKKEETLKQQERSGSNDQKNQQQPSGFAEFDFDLESDKVVSASAALSAQRRPLGSSARPIRERRVARLDKILQGDMVRRQLEAQMRLQQQQQASNSPVIAPDEVHPNSAVHDQVAINSPPQPLPISQPEPTELEDGLPKNTDITNQVADLTLATAIVGTELPQQLADNPM